MEGATQMHAGRTIQRRRGRTVPAMQGVLALRRQTPMVDAVLDPGAGQGAVGMLRPFPPPVLDEAAVLPQAVLAGEAVGIDASSAAPSSLGRGPAQTGVNPLSSRRKLASAAGAEQLAPLLLPQIPSDQK